MSLTQYGVKITQIISNTPVYVWPLLAYLLWGGWKSRKTYVISWKPLLVMPAIMFIWSIYAVMTRYGNVSICLWAVSITIGIWFGSLTVRGLKLRFDKQQNLIEVAGSWSPMILSLSIFTLRYFLGVAYGLHPDLKGNTALLILENIATIVSGMFTGRLVGYWQRSKISPHINLAEVNA